jgi:MinD-like ATPase involved in chromosome partitioning or flagellar assembly
LVEQAARGDVDAALASSDLHRLSAATLTALHQARLPVVLLAESVGIERYRGLAHLLPAASADADVPQALRKALARGPNYGPSPEAGRSEGSRGGVAESENPGGRVIAVVSGKGAPGVTTLAIGLAGALANRGRRVVLVDADLRGGNVVGYLDLDPRRGLLGLTFGGNGASEEARLEEELQEGPGFMVLAGVERPDSRHNVSPELVTVALTTLKALFEDIVVDVGEVVGGISPSTTDAILRSADRVLLVAGADLVALWNARSAVRYLREGLGITDETVAVVLNRKEGREQYAAREVERALGLSVFGMVREDRRAARRAIERQLPITAVRGRTARELRALASRLAVAVPAAAPRRKRRWFRPLKRSLAERT